jgi:GAF domain-containing protein
VVRDDRSDMELAEAMAGVARTLLAEHDVDTTLARICSLAQEVVDGCEFAGISLLEGGRVTTLRSTAAIAHTLDAIQSETQQGPCVDAIKERGSYVTGSLPDERRWPEFSTRAHAETGVTSVLAVRLHAGEDTIGALNLYSSETDAFDDHDVAIAAVFSAHAGVAMARSRREEQLEQKAAGRTVIGQAIGILMEREGFDDSAAFDMLRRASQRMNVKLRDVADGIAHDVDQPGQPSE